MRTDIAAMMEMQEWDELPQPLRIYLATCPIAYNIHQISWLVRNGVDTDTLIKALKADALDTVKSRYARRERGEIPDD